MRTSVAAVSIALLGSLACTPRDVGRGDLAAGGDAPTSPHPALVACHRAEDRTARATRPVSIPLAQLEAVVRARMPEYDTLLHRKLAKAIHEEAREARLDPLLILALIHVESSFDPEAVSYAGATGLMQLRERTLLREIERAGLSPADLDDPVANVRAGIRYLRRLVRAFGSTDLALMAYNAGPNRILSYYRAGEIPDRFHAYPRRIRSERERLRWAIERRDPRQHARRARS